MHSLIEVAEWRQVRLPPHLDTVRVKHRLLRRGATPAGDALVMRGRNIYAQGLAGIVDIGPLQVQIVPKVYADSPASEDAKLLLDLFVAHALPSGVTIVPAATKADHASVLEPLIRHSALQLERELRTEGVPRRYEVRDEESVTLRGRIDFARLASRGPGRELRLPISHYPLQGDNRLTRVLRALAVTLARLSAVARTKASLFRSMDILSEARPEELRPELFFGLELNRLEARWSPFFELAALLASDLSPNPVSPGRAGNAGILLPLDRLFESALREAFRRASRSTPWRVRPSPGNVHLMGVPGESTEILKLRPDLIFEDDANSVTLVADAKWKRIGREKKNLGIKAADAYQIAAYVQRYGVMKGALFYPSEAPIDGTFRRTTWNLLGMAGRTVDIVEVDVAKIIRATKPHGDDQAVLDLSGLLEIMTLEARENQKALAP